MRKKERERHREKKVRPRNRRLGRREEKRDMEERGPEWTGALWVRYSPTIEKRSLRNKRRATGR